ncbi:hypothetical protein GIY62_21270 [Burkholderia plantarii]|nr:hypothetical protein GIY62_21270 [Burkholderia plantarii]
MAELLDPEAVRARCAHRIDPARCRRSGKGREIHGHLHRYVMYVCAMHNASCTIKKAVAQNEKKSVAAACRKLGRGSRTKNVRAGEVSCRRGECRTAMAHEAVRRQRSPREDGGKEATSSFFVIERSRRSWKTCRCVRAVSGIAMDSIRLAALRALCPYAAGSRQNTNIGLVW